MPGLFRPLRTKFVRRAASQSGPVPRCERVGVFKRVGSCRTRLIAASPCGKSCRLEPAETGVEKSLDTARWRACAVYNTLRRETRLISQSTRNTTKRIFAILAAAPAIPNNPNAPAISAISRNTSVQCNMLNPPGDDTVQFDAPFSIPPARALSESSSTRCS